MEPVVVVGTGIAGYSVVRQLRRRDRSAPIVMITADGGEYYSKPSLSNALAAQQSPTDLVVNTAQEMSEATGARIITRTRVLAIDPGRHRIRMPEGELGYSRLVLAVGGRPVRPSLGGDAVDDVVYVNCIDSYAAFRRRLESSRQVIILGGGLIGCEFANDLVVSGHEVTVVELSDQPLPRLLPSEGAALFRQRLEAIGVRWMLGRRAARVDRCATGYRLALDDGTLLCSDLVVAAVGLAPNVGLARESGIDVGRGIQVDRFLATSAPDVYALGDCAEVQGLVLPFIEPITHCARALGFTLSGRRTAVGYPAMPVRLKTPACPAVIAVPSHSAGAWSSFSCKEGLQSLFRDGNGSLQGYALVGAAVEGSSSLTSQLPGLIS